MRRSPVFLASVLAAAVLAPAALADEAGVTAVDLPVRGERAPSASFRSARFDLVGIHWQGRGSVSFRTRSLGGRWSAWRGADPEPEDAPDPGSLETGAGSAWRIGSPFWVGLSDRVETRTAGRVSRVRAYLVRSPTIDVPFRVPAATQRPPIVPRLSWGANEAIRRAPPAYAPRLRFAIVHHTAGVNGYTRVQAPAIVKAIELYHVKGNGWNDIGYNFLVDRFGTIYEGRYGGIDRNVVGAHALGFNTGSVGIALLGTYTSTEPSQAAVSALENLLAWRLDVAHVDPTSLLAVVSGGSERFRAGVPVTLRAVSGHRDTGLTECPGDKLYAKLPAIAAAAHSIGGPKIFDPRVNVSRAGPVRFRATLSTALAWHVSVSDADGAAVADGSGSGMTVDWTWKGSSPPATYRWSISAGSARPASGSIRAGVGQPAEPAEPLAVQQLTATPSSISPNGDGQADSATVTFTLTAPAAVSVDVYDGAENDVLPVLSGLRLLGGKQTVVVDGSSLPDGSYSIVVRALGDDGTEVEGDAPLTVSRVLGLVSLSAPVFSPNGDGRLDQLTVAFSLAASAEARVRVLRGTTLVATPLDAQEQPGTQRFVWDGATPAGTIADGSYVAAVDAVTETGTTTVMVPFAVDTVAPRVRVVSLRPLNVFVSEPARLKITVDGASLQRDVKRRGTIRIRRPYRPRRVRVVATDRAGNVSAPVAVRARTSP
jgi:methionine-rich copper-binding protein CopC